MQKSILTTLLLACATTAGADNFRPQKLALIHGLYVPYQNGNTIHAHPERHFSADLQAVYQEDKQHTPPNEVGCIDYDPIIAGQDWDSSGHWPTVESKPYSSSFPAISRPPKCNSCCNAAQTVAA